MTNKVFDGITKFTQQQTRLSNRALLTEGLTLSKHTLSGTQLDLSI